MKKLLTLSTAILAFLTLAVAGPVDVETAKLAGKNFVTSSFEINRQEIGLQLVYTGVAERGEPCFYVFNVNDEGFVMVSADDRFRPIVGYSKQGTFATDNRSPELDFYLGKIIEARMSPDVVLYDDAAAEWQSLINDGKPFSRNRGKGEFFICKTLWNQDSPYNLYAPAAGSGPGGRCYAGCVATAMSQVMRRWCEPTQGTGSHSYYSSYGMLTANFGNTAYDWEHMPYSINSASPQEEIEAIALLMYHCGVSVNMMFSPGGSGAYSDDVPYAIQHYFGYASQAEKIFRDTYSLANWKIMLKEQFDRGWPVYYSGYSNSGGHAFVCDGYDENDLFHFNWGWGGNSDGFFVIDEIDYANWASAIFDFVPTHVYNYQLDKPSNLTVESLGDADFSAVINWTNPTHTIHGTPVNTLEKVVVCRDEKPIHTFLNPTPGQAMSFTDHYLPTTVTYSVYAVYNNTNSTVAEAQKVILGPTCSWTVEMESSSPQGWKKGGIVVTDGKGIEIATLSLASTSQTAQLQIPMGTVSFSWENPNETVGQIHFAIKDGNQNVVSSFDGTDSEMKRGLFYMTTNSCIESDRLDAPFNLSALIRDDEVLLHWEAESLNDGFFFVYRDGLLYDYTDQFSYTDEKYDNKFHSYYITAYNGIVESYASNSCNVQPTNEYACPTNLHYTIGENQKVTLRWEAPQGATPAAYLIYRRTAGENFVRNKLAAGTSTQLTLGSIPCDVYDFAVTAYYTQTNGESAFASSKANPSLNYVQVNKTIIPMQLGTDLNEDGVTLVWLPALMAESYSVYRNGSLLADGITEHSYLDNTAELNNDYCYTVVGKTSLLTSNESNVACVNWATMAVDESSPKQPVTVYPNPANDQLYVSAPGMKQLTVMNLLGQVVLKMNVDETQTTMDISSLTQGTYILHVATDSGNSTVKIVKM